MYIKAIKITKDVKSIKIAYERDGKLYVRSGKDNFKKGVAVQGKAESLMATWGFRKVTDSPYFYDGQEILENISKFEMNNKGEISYNG